MRTRGDFGTKLSLMLSPACVDKPNMKHRKADVVRLASEQGATITEHDDLGRIFADAPTGKVFSASDLHCMVADWGLDYGLKADAWADLGERMNYGVEPCAIEDCSTCSDLGRCDHCDGPINDDSDNEDFCSAICEGLARHDELS